MRRDKWNAISAILVFGLILSFIAVLPSARAQTSSVSFSVLTDKNSYIPGEAVHAQLNATNFGSTTATFTFFDSCSRFFFEIFSSSGSLVFSTVPPPNAVCLQIIMDIMIGPGQTLTLATLGWNQVDSSGVQVPGGAYSIVGVLHTQSPYQTFPSASKSITILGYSIAVSPPTLSLVKGSSGTFTVTVKSLGGFTGTVSLTASITPVTKHSPSLSGLGSVSLTLTNTSGTSTLTASTERSTTTESFTIAILGTSGTESHSVLVTLNVTTK